MGREATGSESSSAAVARGSQEFATIRRRAHAGRGTWLSLVVPSSWCRTPRRALGFRVRVGSRWACRAAPACLEPGLWHRLVRWIDHAVEHEVASDDAGNGDRGCTEPPAIDGDRSVDDVAGGVE